MVGGHLCAGRFPARSGSWLTSFVLAHQIVLGDYVSEIPALCRNRLDWRHDSLSVSSFLSGTLRRKLNICVISPFIPDDERDHTQPYQCGSDNAVSGLGPLAHPAGTGMGAVALEAHGIPAMLSFVEIMGIEQVRRHSTST